MLNILTPSDIFPQTAETYLSAAEKAAHWLTSLENEEQICDGLSWPTSELNDYATPGLCNGAAGIGRFFLKFYLVTGDEEYLEKARRAGNYIYHEHRYVNMHGPDWFNGAASGGDYFLELYKTTQESDYLEKAKYFADWLFQNKYVENDGYYWKHYPDFPKIYTGIAHGAAGIGLFFLNLYEQSQESKYLDYAEKAFYWMCIHTVRFDETSIGWKRLTRDDDAYHLWCGGSTGIVFFLARFYQVTGEDVYRDYLEQTANGLVKYAIPDGDGVAWRYSSSSSSGFPIIYCHGTSSTTHALFQSNSILNDFKYLNCAQSGAEWLIGQKKSVNPYQYYWNYFDYSSWIETGFLTGVASVGYAFVQFYRFDPDPRYLDMANGAANWLLNVADSPTENQMRWINYTSATSSMDRKEYYTGWYNGAAGIGLFLLELYEALVQTDTNVQKSEAIPHKLNSIDCYPNPFNSFCRITFSLDRQSAVSMEIYDILGRRIETLLSDRVMMQGSHSIIWQTAESMVPLSTGIYVIRMTTNGISISKKITYTK